MLLVPEMVRAQIPDAAIGIFIHATFPSSEIFRCLSGEWIQKDVRLCMCGSDNEIIFVVRNEILSGMVGADLVGFQVRQ